MKKEIFAEIPLNGCVDHSPNNPDNLSVRLQCAEIERGGMGFMFDLLENGKIVYSAGMLATESLFITLYLMKVIQRAPSLPINKAVAEAWRTQISMRLYDKHGGTDSTGDIWVKDESVWVGCGHAGHLVARAPLNETQLAGLTRMADVMDAEFGGGK